jgi:hypothetical protein
MGGHVTSMKKKKMHSDFCSKIMEERDHWKILGGEAWRNCGLNSSGLKQRVVVVS